MSTALAIASVTAVLRDLLQNGMIDRDLTASVGDVVVSALPPDRIDISEATGRSQLNLFLYQVTPNQGWRNVALPSRNGGGERVSNPPLALDLHYLLTAYGARDLHAEILLGYGMQLLHETPVLTREAIRRALAPPAFVEAHDSFPPDLRALFESQLAEQVEQIKITPETLSSEEVSKLWSAFQARYRPTAAYQASVVLIESRAPTRAPLPVRARKIYAVPFRHPTIERVMSQAGDAAPVVSDQPVLAGHNLVLVGHGLRGEDTLVNVGGVEVGQGELLELEDARLSLRLPDALRAGVQGVQVVQRTLMGSPPVPHVGVSSNLAAFVLRPRITAAVADISLTAGDSHTGTARVTVEPAVGAEQRVALFLNELNPPAGRPPLAYSIDAPFGFDLSPPTSPPEETNELAIPFEGVATGTYLARVQVDGAESPLASDAGGNFNAPTLTIP
jgi:hypothetical protein